MKKKGQLCIIKAVPKRGNTLLIYGGSERNGGGGLLQKSERGRGDLTEIKKGGGKSGQYQDYWPGGEPRPF